MHDIASNQPTAQSRGIADRRRRLSLDYELNTGALLQAHARPSGRPGRAILHCLAAVRRQFLPHYFSSPPPWRVKIRRIRKDRALPDFCIIGPAKSGTSDLAVTIMSHPNVLYPLVKEFRSNDPMAWRPFYPTLKAVSHHAQRYGVALCPFVGPCLHCLDIPITLSAVRPDTKIVINLRNPVDLVFSLFKWHLLHMEQRLIERIPFLATFPAYVEKAIEVFPELPSPLGAALHYGIYATSVAHWLRCFGDRNVRVFDVGEYFKDRDAYFENLERFLGLPHITLPPRLPVANPNPLVGFTPTPDSSAMLRRFFEPYNRRLWGVIGNVYSW